MKLPSYILAFSFLAVRAMKMTSYLLLIPGNGAANQTDAPSITPTPGGELEGRVIFRGEKVPEATQVENTTDPDACGRFQSLDNVLVSSKSGGIKNVILALKGVPLPAGYRPKPTQLVLDNRQCRFEPHAAVLVAGSSILATNSDPIFHTVHLYALRDINLALSPRGSSVVEVRRPGTIIVKCDIHGWMQAFIRVDDHPFHAVTDADGSFRIEGIPPGTYTLEAWHEYFGSKKVEVTVKPGSASHVAIHYTSP